MSRDLAPPTPAWRVMRLLWASARKRAAGRSRRQKEIMGRRQKHSEGFVSFSRIVALVAVCLVHGALGWFVLQFARSAGEVDVERTGRIAIPIEQRELLQDLLARQDDLMSRKRNLAALAHPGYADRRRASDAQWERDALLSRLAGRIKPAGRRQQAAAADFRAALERQLLQHGVAGFVVVDDGLSGQLTKSLQTPVAIVPVLGLMFCGWLGMLVCQGEGLELDVQRRRHPMWEWLLSHPIHPAHAFYAELLAPLMANPVYFAAPLFLWVVLGHVFGTWPGLLAALLVGLPVATVTSGVNKAIETTALLRLGVRSRGALLGLLSWFGYVAMLLPFFTFQIDGISRFLGRLGAWLNPWFPAWPVRALTLGWSDTRSLAEVVASWWIVAAALGALALWTTHRATARGLQAPSDGGGPAGVALLGTRSRFGINPLRRKELLWLLRDRSAVVQVVLIPLTIAATQAFNFRSLYHLTTTNWTAICGLAIISGTYFLLVLGPRSLASEGPALWLALTWPHGLEDLLKAKARLWGRVANLVVGGVLAVAGLMFPAAWWKIALVGCGWLCLAAPSRSRRCRWSPFRPHPANPSRPTGRGSGSP